MFVGIRVHCGHKEECNNNKNTAACGRVFTGGKITEKRLLLLLTAYERRFIRSGMGQILASGLLAFYQPLRGDAAGCDGNDDTDNKNSNGN
jgi:hypothetical protein